MHVNLTAIILVAGAEIALQIALGFILARTYLRTRNIGFIWLGLAVVAWPFISGLIEVGERVLLLDRAIHDRSVLSFAQQPVELCLLLVAVVYLARNKSERQTAA